MHQAQNRAILRGTPIIERVFQRLLRETTGPNGTLAGVVRNSPDLWGDDGRMVVLYDPDILRLIVDDMLDPDRPAPENFVRALDSAVVGVVAVGPTPFPCRGAWQVIAIAGEGYGRELYGLAYALSPEGLVVPDRRTVTSKAYRGWKSKASAGLGEPLDDAKHPKNSDPGDDCELHKPEDSDCNRSKRDPDPLNRAYEGEGWEADFLKRVQQNHKDAMEALPPVLAPLVGKIRTRIARAGETFFQAKYDRVADEEGL